MTKTGMKYYRILFLALVVFTIGCDRNAGELYKAFFNAPAPESIAFYNSQENYISDCCFWLHFKIDSSDFNKIIREGYEQTDGDVYKWGDLVPPEAKDWWHPEKLGKSFLYFSKEEEKSVKGIYTNMQRNEVYCVYVFK